MNNAYFKFKYLEKFSGYEEKAMNRGYSLFKYKNIICFVGLKY
jgi:hypothetical protein